MIAQTSKDTHGRTSQLSAADFDALVMYLKSLSSQTVAPTTTTSVTPKTKVTNTNANTNTSVGGKSRRGGGGRNPR